MFRFCSSFSFLLFASLALCHLNGAVELNQCCYRQGGGLASLIIEKLKPAMRGRAGKTYFVELHLSAKIYAGCNIFCISPNRFGVGEPDEHQTGSDHRSPSSTRVRLPTSSPSKGYSY